MKKLLCFSILIFFVIGGCGVRKSLDKAPDFSVLKKGLSRDEVRKIFGKPLEVDSLGNEIYKVSLAHERSYGRATVHAIFDFATLGLWEIVASGAEDKNYGKIAVVYDKADRSVGFLSEAEYEFFRKVLALITEEWKKTDDESKYILLHFDEDKGWFFMDKDNARCSFNRKYLKVYLKKIPTIKSVINSMADYELEDIPAYELQTVFFNPVNNTYTEKYKNIYNSQGKLLLSRDNDEIYDWMEIYPDSLAEVLYDVVALLCVNKYLEKRKKGKKPSLKNTI